MWKKHYRFLFLGSSVPRDVKSRVGDGRPKRGRLGKRELLRGHQAKRLVLDLQVGGVVRHLLMVAVRRNRQRNKILLTGDFSSKKASHHSIFSLAFVQRPLHDGSQLPEECVLLRLGLRPGPFGLGVLACVVVRQLVVWKRKRVTKKGNTCSYNCNLLFWAS